jgi:hypothetical protein
MDFRDIKRKITNFFKWGWRLRDEFSWDYNPYYMYCHYKFKELHDGFSKYGHLAWNTDPKNLGMRRLKEASILAKRLYEDDYLEFDHNKYDISTMFSKKRDPEMEKHFHIVCKIGEFRKNGDRKRFHYLVNKYLDHWWD